MRIIDQVDDGKCRYVGFPLKNTSATVRLFASKIYTAGRNFNFIMISKSYNLDELLRKEKQEKYFPIGIKKFSHQKVQGSQFRVQRLIEGIEGQNAD